MQHNVQSTTFRSRSDLGDFEDRHPTGPKPLYISYSFSDRALRSSLPESLKSLIKTYETSMLRFPQIQTESGILAALTSGVSLRDALCNACGKVGLPERIDAVTQQHLEAIKGEVSKLKVPSGKEYGEAVLNRNFRGADLIVNLGQRALGLLFIKLQAQVIAQLQERFRNPNNLSDQAKLCVRAALQVAVLDFTLMVHQEGKSMLNPNPCALHKVDPQAH